MSVWIPETLRAAVRERARFRCEYCLLHEEDALFPHEVDHITALKHRGATQESNLAYACDLYNTFKGSDVASVDIETGRVERLFNPRTDSWNRHFRIEDGMILARTRRGRVTEYLLQFNRPDRAATRRMLMAQGRYPR